MPRFLLIVMALIAGAVYAQVGSSKLYTINATGWQRSTTPNGEVFTCSVCEDGIQVQIDADPPIGPDSKFKTNEQFLAQLRTPEQQEAFADAMLPWEHCYRVSSSSSAGIEMHQGSCRCGAWRESRKLRS